MTNEMHEILADMLAEEGHADIAELVRGATRSDEYMELGAMVGEYIQLVFAKGVTPEAILESGAAQLMLLKAIMAMFIIPAQGDKRKSLFLLDQLIKYAPGMCDDLIAMGARKKGKDGPKEPRRKSPWND